MSEHPKDSQTVKASALREELDMIITNAEWGIANEQFGGNKVKEEHWRGQRFAAVQGLSWLESQTLSVAPKIS